MNYYVSHGTKERETVVYMHGGAYIEEILPPHFAFARQWTERTGFTVILPNYPTVPAADAKS